MEKIWEEYQYKLNIIIGNCDFVLIVVDDNNNNDCRLKECTLGNLASDAIKDAGKGEITLVLICILLQSKKLKNKDNLILYKFIIRGYIYFK